jgi:hypothetical protein
MIGDEMIIWTWWDEILLRCLSELYDDISYPIVPAATLGSGRVGWDKFSVGWGKFSAGYYPTLPHPILG